MITLKESEKVKLGDRPFYLLIFFFLFFFLILFFFFYYFSLFRLIEWLRNNFAKRLRITGIKG